MDSFKNILAPDRIPCMTKVWKPLIPNQRERYLSPEELKNAVYNCPRIVELLNEQSENNQIKLNELQKSVRDMLNEIGLDRSMTVIRWSGICLNGIMQKLCAGIYVNEDSIDRLKRTMGNQPVLYLPSHRSYADFVLMSYICFSYDIEIPAIAAGMDFYSMVGLGTVLRKTGAFYMRRSFSNDKLYWHVFKEYMRALVNVYHIGVEFFIEGTRSRSMKALVPKVGLLSMALEPLFMGEVMDITIVPVGVAYEKNLEEQLFVYELLGVPKPKESTMAFFKALKILEIDHGNMYINFGRPLSVSEYLGGNLDRFRHAQLPAHVQHLAKTELAIINKLANHVVSQQQHLIVLSTFNLIAIYFSHRMYLDEITTLDQLAQGVLELATHLQRFGALVTIESHNVKAKILDSLQIHSNILQLSVDGFVELMRPMIYNLHAIGGGRLKGYKLATDTVRCAVPMFSLQLYCNPCMHWLVIPAFVILAAKVLCDTDLNKETLREEVEKLKTIFSLEFVFDNVGIQNFDYVIDYLIEYGILNSNTLKLKDNGDKLANLFISSVVPFVLCYLQVIETILAHFSDLPFTEKELLVSVQKYTEIELNAKNSLIHPYCLSLDSIGLAINSLQANDYLEKNKSTTSTNSTIFSAKCNRLQEIKSYLLQYSHALPHHCYSNYLRFTAKL